MIDVILPSWVKSAEAFDDSPVATVFPEEEALVSGAAERRREFRTARLCAHRAMRLLDLEPQPVLRGERGAPMWPSGVVGSITHCAGYRAAVVAIDALAIGIDAEPHGPVFNGLLERIATTAEIADLDRLGVEHPGRLLFSAKESIYKAWHPLTGRWLGFLDAAVTFNLDGSFTARITPPASTTCLEPAEFRGPDGVTMYLKSGDEQTELLESIVLGGQESGEFEVCDATIAARTIVHAIDGALDQSQKDASTDLDGYADELIPLMLRMLGTKEMS